MKKILLGSVAVLLLTACQNKSGEAVKALELMDLTESGKGRTSWAEKDVSGDRVVLKDVLIDTDGLADRIEADIDDADSFNIVLDLYDANIAVDVLTFDDLKTGPSGHAVFGRVDLKGVSLAPLDPSYSPNLKVAELSLENPSPELAAWLAGLFGKGEETGIPAPDAIAFDQLTLSGVSWNDPDLGDRYQSGLKTLRIESVTEDTLGALELRDLKLKFYDAYSPEPGVFSVSKIDLKGGNPDFLTATQSSDPFEMVSDMAGALFSMPLDGGVDSVKVEALNFALDGVTSTLPDLSYVVSRDAGGMPLTSRLEPVTLTLAADPEGGLFGAQVSPYLSAYGVDQLQVTTSYSSVYDPKTDIVKTSGNYVEINDAFRISYDFTGSGVRKLQDKLNSVDPDDVLSGERKPEEIAADLYSQLDLHAFSMTIEDMGAISKLTALASIMQGISPDEVRQRINGMMALGMFGALMLGVDENILQDVNIASRAFIAEGGTLTLSLQPQEPLALAGLIDKPSLATKDTLGLTVVHTAPVRE